MFEVVVYDIYNNTHKFPVGSMDQGREYAKRIITEGLWELLSDGSGEVFYPVHQIVKVKVRTIKT